MVNEEKLLNSSQKTTAAFLCVQMLATLFVTCRNGGLWGKNSALAVTIGSVPECVAHSEQNESISVIVPIKCPNIFCDEPQAMGLFEQVPPLRAKRAISYAHWLEYNPPKYYALGIT